MGDELNTNLSTAKTTSITDKTRGRMNINPRKSHSLQDYAAEGDFDRDSRISSQQ